MKDKQHPSLQLRLASFTLGNEATCKEFIQALSAHVEASVEKAITRCTANGRSTLRPEDI